VNRRHLTRATGLFAVASVLALASPRTAPAQGTSEVRANGSATIPVAPDLAIVTIQFSAAGRTPAIAGRAAATRANAIRVAIVALGIPRDSLPTTGRWGRWGGRSEVQVRNDMKDTSYVTNDVFAVRIHDFALIGRVIDTALFVGAQTISNVEFRATNTTAATIEAIKQATRMARAHADAVAEASGLKLGRALDLGVDGAPMLVASSMAMSEGGAMFRMADAATTVVSPELHVTMSVSGRWELVAPR
jgi:uncharacterized protein YggE